MELKTSRLHLREFEADDWRTVLAYQCDPRYLRYYPQNTRSKTEVEAFVQRIIEWQQESPRTKFQVAIVLADSGKLIGNCGLRMNKAGEREADLGYEIAPQHWGYGYATEAARALLAFGFETLNLHRIWASVLAENVASARVLEKLGMRREGRFRRNQWLKNRWHDTLIYAVLDQDWRVD